jgi:aspartyl-tRNA(Asn)/glutamyl-tRNA(Gln) amidotransferase subunit B
MFEAGADPAEIVKKKGLQQITDTSAIEAAIDAAVAANPKQAELYRSGKTSVSGWFVGQVMKATGGKANPKIVNEILAKKLGG